MNQQKVKTKDFKAMIFHSEQLIIFSGDSKKFFDWLETNKHTPFYHYNCKYIYNYECIQT